MKITKAQIRKIIKEELSEAMMSASEVQRDSAHNVLTSVSKLLGDIFDLKKMPGIEGETLEAVEELKSKLHTLLNDLQAYTDRVDPL